MDGKYFGFVIAVACATTVSPWAATRATAEEPALNYDPSRIIENEAENCAQCHEKAVEAWSQSTHKITFDELHTRDTAKTILESLGARGSIKRSAECVQCHYTQHAEEPGGRARTIMGVSCQRCHGAGIDWVDIHQDEEKYPDKTERLKLAEAAGMRPTYNVYKLASSCFQCHTVPREGLVNGGEHPAGSQDFELVAWTHGEVRHNFLPRPEGENKEDPPERKRLLYVMGKLLDLEYALRGLEVATQDGLFLTAMSERAARAYDAIGALGIGGSEIDTILAAVPKDGSALKLVANNGDEYRAAANTIGEQAQALEARKPDLSAVDSKLPSEYRGVPYE